MAKLPLHQGSYTARSPIANAQVCINLYPEQNPPDAPFPVTMYPAPGTRLLADLSALTGAGPVRGLYTTSNGVILGVAGTAIFQWYGETVQLGQMDTNTGAPVSMVDNGTTVVLVDGTPTGYMAALSPAGGAGLFGAITDPNFYGANRVDFIDTFMIFNRPASSDFYTTTSNVVTPFDPTYIAAKEGYNDHLVTLAALHDNIWLFGNVTTEIWFNAGGAAFPFARMPNSILQQGCIATYSVVVADNAVYWLSQDRWGRAMLMRGEGYAARRVSTFAIENEWMAYAQTADCVAMAFQFGGHEQIGLLFPSANSYWVYDASTQMWHRRCYDAAYDAWLPSCTTYLGHVEGVTFETNIQVAGSRLGPQLLQIDQGFYTDHNGVAIQRQRSWMHLQQDGQRIAYTRFALSMTGANLTLGGAYPDEVLLDWSDDGGQSYGASVPQTINQQRNGQYLWRRLGYGRDRVYRISMSAQGEFAINGAYSDGVPEAT